jgi:hypothetical protein
MTKATLIQFNLDLKLPFVHWYFISYLTVRILSKFVAAPEKSTMITYPKLSSKVKHQQLLDTCSQGMNIMFTRTSLQVFPFFGSEYP